MAKQPSPAENLFNEIRNKSLQEQYERLAKMISEHEKENEWLEFKGAGHVGDKRSDPKIDEWLKAEWAKYLSGFANSGGGLVIWGIETKQDEEKSQDLAEKWNYVQNVDQFTARLNDLINSATYPPVQGIINLPIKEPDSQRGCVISYVPNSPHKPHCAKYGYLKRKLPDGKTFCTGYGTADYYIRVGDDCGVMTHETLRHSFYSKSSPYLTTMVKIKWDNDPATQFKKSHVTFQFEVKNDGTSTAHDVMLHVKSPHPNTCFSGEGTSFIGNLPVHIGNSNVLGSGPVTFPTKSFPTTGGGSRIGPMLDTISFEVTSYAQNMDPIFGVVVFSEADILENKTKIVVPAPPEYRLTVV